MGVYVVVANSMHHGSFAASFMPHVLGKWEFSKASLVLAFQNAAPQGKRPDAEISLHAFEIWGSSN